MLLTKDIELIDGIPVAYIKSIKSLVISDLHLGYESQMAGSGVFIPKANLKNILKILETASSGRDANQLIIVGDIKNEFSKVNADELNEINELLKFAQNRKLSIILIKGNHDNFIESYSKYMPIMVHAKEAEIGGYLFVHGNKKLSVSNANSTANTLIIGHEHPSIGIPKKVGAIERFRCFLYGDYKPRGFNSKLLVLPAIGYFETGSDINLNRKSDGFKALLGKKDIDQMDAIAIDGNSTINFGKINKLRDLDPI